MRKRKFLDIFLLCLKIILPILILIPLVFFSYRPIEGRIEDIANIGTEGYFSGMGLYIFLSHIVLLGVNVVLLIIGCIGLLISKKYSSSPVQQKNVLAFRYLTFVPIVSQLLYVVINLIVMNIG